MRVTTRIWIISVNIEYLDIPNTFDFTFLKRVLLRGANLIIHMTVSFLFMCSYVCDEKGEKVYLI